MSLIVQKYGGTSVGSIERIHNVARRCLATQRAGHDVVVVVSAMAGETNRLLALTEAVARRPGGREQDVVVASGEQVSAGLLALAIQDEGGKARSFLAHQVRILTDSTYSRARIRSIDAEKIFNALRHGEIAVVTGFQGVDEQGNVTTLGRGGSDTTGVALAAALKADACEIYTDVHGVYTADPNACPTARKLDRISFEEMMELASLGAKVLQIRAVELAFKYRVPLRVLSSFTTSPGTLVCLEDTEMEQVLVSGVAHDKNQAKITVRGMPDRPGVVAQLFGALADADVVVDVIVQGVAQGGRADLSFTLGRGDLARADELVRAVAEQLGAGPIESDAGLGKVSIVGVGMRNHSGVAAKMFRILAEEKINVQMISTSEIKVSCVIDEEDVERAVQALHSAFSLDHSGPGRG